MNISNMKVDSLDDMINAFSARIRRLKNFTDKSNIKENENKTMDDKLTLYKITYIDNEEKENSTNDISLWAKNELDAEEKFKTYFDKRDRFDIDSIEVDLVLTEGCKEETITEDIVDKLRDFTPADDASYGGIKNFPNGDKPQYGEVLSGNFDASFAVGCNLEDDIVVDIILGTPEDDDFESYNEYQYVIEVDSDDPQDIENYASFAKNFTKVTMSRINKLFDAEDVDKYLMKNQFTRIHSEWDESLSIKESNSSKDAIDITDLFNEALNTISEYIEVIFRGQLGMDIAYHKIFKTVDAAEKYNYHSDYWNSAEVYQENTSELVKMFKPYFGKRIRLNNEIYAFEGKLIGIDIDTQYNGHLALMVDDPVELDSIKESL